MDKLYKLYARLFASSFFYKWNYYLFRFALCGMGVLNFYNSKVSGERYFINSILQNFISFEEPIFFDAGANEGNYSLALQKQFPSASIHSFEPHPKNFKRLSNHNALKGQNLNEMALGDQTDIIRLYDYIVEEGSSHASLYKGVFDKIHKQEAEIWEVQQDTIDNYCEKQSIKTIDLLKVDVEGHELCVLKGGMNMIQKGRIKLIHFEFNEMNIESEAFMKDFYTLLDNYLLYRMLPNDLLPLDHTSYRPVTHEIFAFQNILAIRKDLLS